MKRILLFGLFISLLFVIACSPQVEEKQQPDPVKAPKPVKEVEAPENQEQKPKIIRKEAPKFSPNIVELIDKSKAIKSYEYSFSSRERDSFGNYKSESFDVLVKSEKVVEKYPSPIKIGDDSYYNKLYFNTLKRSAVGVCDAVTTLCSGVKDKAFKVDYKEITLPPTDLLWKIPVGTKEAGEEKFDGRAVLILEYEQDGKLVRLAVDNYFGIPMRYQIISKQGDKEILELENRYTRISANGLKDSDVSPPSGLKIIG